MMTLRFDGTVCPNCQTYFWRCYDSVPGLAEDESVRLLDRGSAFSMADKAVL